MKGNYTRAAWALILALTLLRFLLAGCFELVGDEAYYWHWAQHPAMAYYSKPPGVAWAIRLGTWILGDTERGVRLVSVLLSAGTSFLVFRLGASLFSPRVGFWSLVLASVAPMFIGGGLLMTIDAISVFFWLLAALAFLATARDPSPGRWLLAGLSLGAGLLAKLTNLALIPSFVLFCLWSPGHRALLRRPGFWGLVAVALLFLGPVLIWNSSHGWITFHHLQERGALDKPFRFSAGALLTFVGLQLAVIGPALLPLLVAAMRVGGRAFPDDLARRFSLSLFLPLILFYTVLACNNPGEANWTAGAWASFFPVPAAAGLHLADASRAGRLLWRGVLGLSAVLAALLLYAIVGFYTPSHPDLFARVRGARDLAGRVMQLRAQHHADFVIAHHYQTASLIGFYGPGHPQPFTWHQDPARNQLDLWPGYRELYPAGSTALYVAKKAKPAGTLWRDFESVEVLEEVQTHFRGQPVRPYTVYLCRGLRTNEPPAEPAL